MAAEWASFPKMEQTTNAFATLPKGDWVVTEKLHGANFSVSCDETGTVFFAKRSGVLPLAEDFFSFRSQRLDEDLANCARRAFGAAQAADNEVRSVCVYGELLGGAYPASAEVPPVAGLRPVQKGVWYSPSLRFVGFDVRVTARPAGERAGARFLDFAEARRLAEAAGFLFAAPMASGSLAHCLDFGFRFDSTLPARLGLPPLPGPNLAEGVVLRAAMEVAPGVSCGGRGGGRAMFKRKIAEFGESQYANNGWRVARAGGTGTRQLPPAELLRYELLAAVTEQRLASVASKLGRADPTDQAACRALLEGLKADAIDSLVVDKVVSSREAALENAQLRSELDRAARGLVVPFSRAEAEAV